MENDLDRDEFELFLKQKVDQHKLYPSENAWKGIYNSLHPGMKWFKVGGSLLILSTLFFVFQQTSLFSPSNSSLNNSGLSSKKTFSNNPVALQSNVSKKAASPNGTKDVSSQNPSINSVEINNSIVGNHAGSVVTRPAIVSEGNAQSNNLSNVINPFNLSNSVSSSVPVNFPKSPGLKSEIPAPGDLSVSASNAQPSFAPTGKEVRSAVANRQLKGFILSSNLEYWQNLPIIVAIPSNHVTQNARKKQEEPTDISEGRELKTSEIKVTTIGSREDVSLKDINWLQEMAAIKLTTHKKSPFNIQFYFSPTVNYRRLADNQNSSHTGIFSPPVSTRDLNINNYVNHSSALGAELGANVLFSVNRNLIFKTGLQLNYTRYNIKAYRYSNEKTSIVLNTAGPVPDTLSSYTSIRNFTGYAPEQLQNQYLQVSVPIGAELKVIGNKRLQFNVAGSIQPTFLLFSDTYLLSTNYVNYTKEPSLVRKWNLNSAFEAFLSYKTGGLRWQLGPQFRYQLMSSYNDRYPIKEYLFEYGVKIGVSKTIR